jgi:hypothetical protein
MIEITRFFFFLLSSLSLYFSHSWIGGQVNESLKHASITTNRQLHEYFIELSEQGAQVLYCRIRNNAIQWEFSPRTDSFRNPHIVRFFNDLAKKYPLPNTDFILQTDDGRVDPAKFPLFSFSALDHLNVFLFPDFEMLWEIKSPKKDWRKICKQYSELHPWETKLSKGFFRGAGTGKIDHAFAEHFNNSRMKAMIFSAQFPQLLDAAFSIVYSEPMYNAYAKLGKTLQEAAIQDHFQYKYLLDIDGNANTYSRCRWILLSNSVLLKVASPFRQWYYRAIQPWVHYIPIQEDLSDLQEALNRLKNDDDLAKRIAENGHKLGEQIFSREAVEAYVVRLLRAYAKTIKIT